MHRKNAYVYVLFSSLLWGSTAAVAKLMLKNLDNFQVLLVSSFIAIITLFTIVLFQKKLPIFRQYSIKDYLIMGYKGTVGIFLYFIFLYAALMFTTAQEAFIINYTWPIWVVIFAAIILKEKLTIKKVFAIVLGFIGVYVVVTKGVLFNFSGLNISGGLLAMAGGVSYGLFSVLGKKHDYDRFTSMTIYYAYTFILTLVATLIFSKIPVLSLSEFIGLCWLGIFTSGLAHVFWFLALKYGDTAKMSNMIFLTPFLSLVYIYFLLGEVISIYSVIGLVLIVVGILYQSLSAKKLEKHSKS